MTVTSLAGDMLDSLNFEAQTLREIGGWYRKSMKLPAPPRHASEEVKRLIRLSSVPLLRLIVDTTAQPLFVTGYRSPDRESPLPAWDAWTHNDLDSRQVPLHYDVVKHGYAYVTVTPGELRSGEPMPVIRPVSAVNLWAEFDDPAGDEFPIHALQRMGKTEYRFFDEEIIVDLQVAESPEGKKRVVEVPGTRIEHGMGVCPVVRYENQVDLEGNCVGEIEPYISVAQRIEKTMYDRMLTQHHNSWKIIYATGMEPPKGVSPEEAARAKVKIRQDDVVVAGEGVNFGQLDETSLSGFHEALEMDIQLLSAISQTPTTALTGQMVNLSADALAASRTSHTQKLRERQHRLGDAHARVLRLAAKALGDDEGAEDFEARVRWSDVETRSLAQTADGLGKLHQMLNVPKRALWSMVPGADDLDVQQWEEMADEERQEAVNIEMLLSGHIGPGADNDGSDVRQQAPGAELGVQTGAPSVDTGRPSSPATYENQAKPWATAKRGPRTSDAARVTSRYRRKRDGDGDGIRGE